MKFSSLIALVVLMFASHQSQARATAYEPVSKKTFDLIKFQVESNITNLAPVSDVEVLNVYHWPFHIQASLRQLLLEKAGQAGSSARYGRFSGDLFNWSIIYRVGDEERGSLKDYFFVGAHGGPYYAALYQETGGFWPGEWEKTILYVFDSSGVLNGEIEVED